MDGTADRFPGREGPTRAGRATADFPKQRRITPVNVVFLLLTAAVGAGAEPAQQPTKPADKPAAAPPAAPAYHHPVAPGCCGGCATSSCCEADCCDRPGLFDRLRGLFRKNDCCDTCCPAPCCPAPAPCCKPVVIHAPCCAPSCCDTCEKPSFLDRLRARFRKNDCCEPCCTPCTSGCGTVHHHAPAMPPGADKQPERLKMPKGDDGKGKKDENKGTTESTAAPALTPAPTATPPAAKVETESKNPFESGRRRDQRFDRAADYSRLTGQLYFVHADGGIWVLRYAPLSEEDANGGSVILARDRRMDSYREGDLITVEGRVISEKGSPRLGGALYQVHTIRLVDRPQR
jgi:hypothetical protein